MQQVLTLIKKKHMESANIIELTQLVLLLGKFDIDYAMYKNVLLINNFCIDRSTKTIQQKELDHTKNKLN